MQEISSAPVVKLEYAGQQDAEPIFADNVGSASSIAEMNIQPSDQPFDEEWIYRFTYNPPEKVLNSPEITFCSAVGRCRLTGPPICRKKESTTTAYWSGPKVSINIILHNAKKRVHRCDVPAYSLSFDLSTVFIQTTKIHPTPLRRQSSTASTERSGSSIVQAVCIDIVSRAWASESVITR